MFFLLGSFGWVADLISQGKCLFYEQPDDNIIAARNLLILRKQLKKQEHRLRMRIRNGLLAKYFPELDRHWGNNLEENLAIVRWCLDPRKIASSPMEEKTPIPGYSQHNCAFLMRRLITE